jgi:transcriptional regulator with XRE-family HTH domain
MSVGENIQKLLKELGLNRKQLAKLANLKESTVYDACRREGNPSSDTLKKIIIALGVSADMVLFDDDEQTNNNDIQILARQLEGFKGEDREMAKEMMSMIILRHKSKELMSRK